MESHQNYPTDKVTSPNIVTVIYFIQISWNKFLNILQKRNDVNEKLNDLLLFDEGVKKLVPWFKEVSMHYLEQVEKIWGYFLGNNFVLICLNENSKVCFFFFKKNNMQLKFCFSWSF